MDNQNIAEPGIKQYKKFLGIKITKKKIIWTTVIVVVFAVIVLRVRAGQGSGGSIQTDVVKKQDIKSTVLATGQVVSGTDLDLGFKVSGVIDKVYVQEGDKVKAGQKLAALDQKDQLASVTSAKGALALAQANYQKVLDGASSEDIAVAQAALDSAQTSLDTTTKQQQVLVANAYSALLNSGLAAVPASGNIGGVAATITGTYNGTDQGMYQISIYATGNGMRYRVSGLESGDGLVDVTPKPLGSKGLYIQFSTTNVPASNSWTVTIPNTLSSTYVTNYNAYQAALQAQTAAISAAQSAVTSAQANLDLKKAQARPADVQAAQAQILSAQGQVQSAQAGLDNTTLTAPADGVITSVDIKTGEQATALKEALILQDVSNLHIEADVSEANIAQVQPGQTVDVTFDALGPDRHFTATVQTVNPASTVISGVVNYKVTATVGKPDVSQASSGDSQQNDLIKPGMTANMTIQTAEKDSVLAIPLRAVINDGGTQHVRVVDDVKKKTYHEVDVQTGMQADGGLVEILSGLQDGQQIVTYIKQ